MSSPAIQPAPPTLEPPGTNSDQTGDGSHTQTVVEASENGHIHAAAQRARAVSEALLAITADALDGLERQRIASENRLRSLREVKQLRGTRAETQLEALTVALVALEHEAELELKRTIRQHPLGPWVKRTVGIGEKQGARLIAAIGDPTWNYAADRPRRGPAELWAYCGFVPGQKRKKGVRSNWNPIAKSRAYLCAESCMKKANSPYRAVYERARANAEGKVHDRQCQNTVRPSAGAPRGSNGCGTREHPEWGAPGTLWRPGHEHGHALRVVAKEILKDLWREASTTDSSIPMHTASGPLAGVAV